MCVCEYVSVYTSVCAPSFPFPTGYWWGPSQRVWVEQSNLEEDSKSFVQSSWSDLSFFVSSRCNRSRTTALSEEPPSVSDIDLPMALGLSDALVTWWGTQALRRRRQNSGPRTFSTCHLWVVGTWPGLATWDIFPAYARKAVLQMGQALILKSLPGPQSCCMDFEDWGQIHVKEWAAWLPAQTERLQKLGLLFQLFLY